MGRKKVSAGVNTGAPSRIASGEISSKDTAEVQTSPSKPVGSFDGKKAENREQVFEAMKAEIIGDVDDLIESRFYQMNYRIHEFEQVVSPDPRHWVVHWFFPNAKDGAIYVDYPRSDGDAVVCERKAKIMKELGLKYKIYQPEEIQKMNKATSVINDESDVENEARASF